MSVIGPSNSCLFLFRNCFPVLFYLNILDLVAEQDRKRRIYHGPAIFRVRTK